jgi:hypothetical protein
MSQHEAEYTAADGQAAENLERAVRAVTNGKFEKATAYALIALAYQKERDEVIRRVKGGWAA